MKINFTGRNFEIPPALKDFAEQRLEKLKKIAVEPIEVSVIMTVERYNHIVELGLKDKNSSFIVSEKSNSMLTSLRRAFDTIEKKIKKGKEKYIKNKRRVETPAPLESVPFEGETLLTRSNDYFPKPITLEEAIKFFNLNKKEVLVFRNLDSNKIAVLYKRKDGTLSLIEPDL
ncbi:MAG: ribosome hibernation-promoting factor, HPF/YfiA family [Candidatus Aminicenantia bacterium]